MGSNVHTNRQGWLAIAGLVFASAGASAQQAPLAPDQISGATLRLWLEQKVAYAGIIEGPRCHFMNAAQSGERVLFFTCPDGNSKALQGRISVVGDEWCTSFPAPAGDECVTWHALPDGRFAQKLRGVTSTTVHLLSVVPMKAAAR